MYFQIKVNESGRCHNLVSEKFLLMKKLKVKESPVKKKKKKKKKKKEKKKTGPKKRERVPFCNEKKNPW